MDFNFSDQIILITGGTGALGLEVSELFVRFSPQAIVITYRSEPERINTEKRLGNLINDRSGQKNKTKIEFARADLLKEDEVQNLIVKTIAKFGQVHVLVNIVGG